MCILIHLDFIYLNEKNIYVKLEITSQGQQNFPYKKIKFCMNCTNFVFMFKCSFWN